MHRLRVLLFGLAIVFAVTGAAALLASPALESGATASPARPTPPAAVAAAGDTAGRADAVARVVNGNLFALDRSAPRSRYSPGEAESTEPLPVAVVASVEPVLLGTIAGAGAGSALVRFAGSAEPRLMQVGETVGRWRLTHVDERTATLEGPPGTRQLSLRSAAAGTP